MVGLSRTLTTMACLMYSQDYDETMPFGFGYYAGIGWLWNYYHNVPWNAACGGGVCARAGAGS